MPTLTYDFNYTGQSKIKRKDFEIELFNNDGKLSFSLKLNLEGYRFHKSSPVDIRAKFDGQIQRFNIGTVGNLSIQPVYELNEIEGTDIVDFDILVIHQSTPNKKNKWEGFTKNIRIGVKERKINSESQLPVNIIDLGERPWNIQFTPAGPILELNIRIPNVKDKIENDPVFRLMIFPIAYRQILERIIYLNDIDSEEQNWQAKWLKFTKIGLNIPETPQMGCDSDEPDEEQELWINQCVNQLCHKNKLMEKLLYQEKY